MFHFHNDILLICSFSQAWNFSNLPWLGIVLDILNVKLISRFHHTGSLSFPSSVHNRQAFCFHWTRFFRHNFRNGEELERSGSKRVCDVILTFEFRLLIFYKVSLFNLILIFDKFLESIDLMENLISIL